ncbi:SRPBCC family protein [Mesorhizobium sp. 1B3]|uniref:SRPBCC family protein n=1 Tax=Mesorhizobium sp. 1B3 TaxID=3243599 RepID=UPI003D964DDA
MLKPIAIRIERDIKASPATVWACLTRPDLIAQWFFAVDFQPRAGHRFCIRGDEALGWRGWTDVEVIEIQAPRRMVWSFDCTEQAPPGRVVFTLEERAGFVRFVLTHEGRVPMATRRLLDTGWADYAARLSRLAESNRLS